MATAAHEPSTSVRPELLNEPRGSAAPDVALSTEARAALEAGLASARRGEIKPWGDFSKYAADDVD